MSELRVQRQSVQEAPTFEETPRASTIILQLASIADDIEPWGRHVHQRDIQLRQFWPTESTLASAIYTIVSRNVSFNWELTGPPRTVKSIQQMFHRANFGKGWLDFISKLSVDLFTQDNGAFIEIIRATNSKNAVPISFAHLDSGRCRRTGVRDWPVIYTDRLGAEHKLAPWQVVAMSEFPSPMETMNGVQLCAVSRVLRVAQLLRDIAVYKREKVSGRNPQAIHLMGGINQKELQDALSDHGEYQVAQGYMRFIKPLLFASIDPTVSVSHVEIPLASLPDGFDEETTMRWYINSLAMGFGADYQDFAPLPGRSLGSGSQSLILHMKSRGKGPALFMKTLEHLFNFHNILPGNVTFAYKEQDLAEDMEQAELRKIRAETYKIYIETGAMTPEAVRQKMLDNGELTQEVFDSLQEEPDITPDVTATDEEPVDTKARDGIADDFEGVERIRAEEALEKDMAKALGKMFAILKKKLLGRSKAFSFKAEEPTALLSDVAFWQEFRTEMVGEFQPHVRKGALEAAKYNRDLGLTVNMDLVNAEVLAYTASYTNEWWMALEGTTRDGLREAITAWQETGLGKRGLPDLVDAIEPMFGKARAERIAANEITKIFDEGNMLAHISAGVEEEEWQTAGDDIVCPICRPLDGNRYKTTEGPRPVTGTHIGCRCARLPVANNRTLRKR